MDEPMKKWQIAVSILLIFAVGTAVGAYGSRVNYKNRVSKALTSEGTPGIKVIQKMVGRLDLSESQRTAISAIVDENNETWESIRQEYEPKIQALFKTVIEETKKELTPQQREEVEKMSADVERRLPRRSHSSPRSAASPEGSVPSDMDPPHVSKSNPGRVAAILDELQVDPDKLAALQTIIEADLEIREVLREDFQKSQESSEEKFHKESDNAWLATEKKLEGLLTPEQIETYGQLMRREEPPPDDFIFDMSGETRKQKNFRKGDMPAPDGGDSGRDQP